MGKRIVSILLISILFLQMLPCAAIAETVLYAYPEVNAYLAADEMEQYEREYRLWAAELIRKYRYEYAKLTDEHDLNSAWNALYKEYWNAAKLKTGFISQLGDELKSKLFFNSSAETILTYAETGKTEEYYMYVFLQSLEEAVKVDPDLKEQYESMPKKDRIYMTIDLATGKLEKDVGLEAVEKAADEQFYADLRTLGTDIAVLTANVAYYYLNPKAIAAGMSKGKSDVIAAIKDVLLETLEAGLENAIDDVLENEKSKLENGVKSDLASDFAGKMMTVNAVTLEYVEQAYLELFEYGDQTPDWGNIEGVAQEFVRMAKENREELASLTAEEAKLWTTPSAEDVLNSFSMELEGILKGSEIVVLSFIEASRAGIFEVIDQLKSLVKKRINGEVIPTDQKDSRDLLVSIVEGVFNLVQNLVDKGLSAATDDLREKLKNDEECNATDMLTVMGKYIAEHFGEEAVKQIETIVDGVIPDGKDIFEYSQMKSDTVGTFGSMVWGMLYQAVRDGGESVLMDIAKGKNDTSITSGVKGLGAVLKVASEAEKELASQTETLEQQQKKAEERAAYWEKEMVKDANAYRQAEDDEQAFSSRQDYYFSQEERDKAVIAGENLKENAKHKKNQTSLAQIGSALGKVWGDMMEVSQSLRDTCVSGTLAANNDAAVGLELARMESAYRASLAMEIEATHRTAMYYDDVKFDGSVTYSITYTPEEQKRLGLSSPYYEYTTLDDALKVSGFLSPEYILNNPEGTSINDIRKIISMIYMQIKYDIVGANIYDSIVMKENDVAGAAYIKYAQKNHNNIYGSKGLLPYSSAHRIYNSIVDCQSWFGESGAYKEEWDVLFK